MNTAAPCPACASERLAPLRSLDASTLWSCPRCGCLWIPQVEGASGGVGYHTELDPVLYNSYYDALRTAQGRAVLTLVEAASGNKPPSDWLDVGCGSGMFVSLARDRGIDAWGVDVSLPERRHRRAPACMREATIDEVALEGRRFQVVSLFNVLEHLTDPEAVMHKVRALVEPGGFFAFSMPLRSGFIFRTCEALARACGDRASGPLKTLLQWSSSAPHVFVPTLPSLNALFYRTLAASVERFHYQRIVYLRGLHRRVRLEQKRLGKPAWTIPAMYAGGVVLGLAGRAGALVGRPDEVYGIVRVR